MLDKQIFESAIGLRVCKPCLLLFMDPDMTESFLLRMESSEELVTEGPLFIESQLEKRIIAMATEHGKVEVAEKYLAVLATIDNTSAPQCPCCNGYLRSGLIRNLAIAVHQQLQLSGLTGRPVITNVIVPPSVDLLRVVCRAAVYRAPDKGRGERAVPPLEELLQRMLTLTLSAKWGLLASQLTCNQDRDRNAIQIDVKMNFDGDAELAFDIFPTFTPKGPTRVNTFDLKCALALGQSQVPETQGADTNDSGSSANSRATRYLALCDRLRRNNIDPSVFAGQTVAFELTVVECSTMLSFVKGMRGATGRDGLDKLRQRLSLYSRRTRPAGARPLCNVQIDPQVDPLLSPLWTVSVSPRPVYLFGRYRKLARDVPQSPWALNAQSMGSKNGFAEVGMATEAEDDSAGLKRRRAGDDGDADPVSAEVYGTDRAHDSGDGERRKGRNSVEEIIAEAVRVELKASVCRMHACGREDIDVRCLGNGRPFCMEVHGAMLVPTEMRLQQAMHHIACRTGLNKDGDVELLLLKEADRATWEGMQKAAEEKDKAYSCVVWCARALVREDLDALQQRCRAGPTAQHLEIQQKTPLRVVHRRSLLNRTRHISNVEAVLLSPHYFLLRLQTSAGTYVKEWVHGDLGRTTPSVCSMLGAQTDILQLDVVWLFDEFEGGGQMPTTEVADRLKAVEQERRGYLYLPWSRMACTRVPPESQRTKANHANEGPELVIVE